MKAKTKPRATVVEASSPEAKRRMEACRGRDTAPELALRSLLHRQGLRFRVDHRVLKEVRRRADLVFAGPKVVVFIDGCFWHGCPQHATWPKANAEFWREKIETNRRRDIDTDRRLTDAGWRVIRIWEHVDPLIAVPMVAKLVRERSKEGRKHAPRGH